MSRLLRLLGSVKAQNLDLQHVRAEVHLPGRAGGQVRIKLYPDHSSSTMFDLPFEWSFTGEICDAAGNVVEEVVADRVYTECIDRSAWGPDTLDVTVTAFADDVRTVLPFVPSNTRQSRRDFWLSPGPLLNPVQLIKRFATGDVRVRTSYRKRLSLGEGVRLLFDRHYEPGEGGADARASLVAQVKSEKRAEDLLPLVEDVLLLASVSMRHQVVCTGWSQIGPESIVECHRGNIAVPRNTRWTINDALVPPEHTLRFLSRSYQRLIELQRADLLRQVLWQISPVEPEPVHRRIARLYSALESLVLTYSGGSTGERILSKKEFAFVRLAIGKTLAKAVAPKTKRSQIEEKLSELNRPSFRTALSKAAARARLNLDTLWPIASDSDGIGLSRIRNKVVHGDYVPYHPSLEVAGDHLQWLVERLLLARLGWPIARSYVRDKALHQYKAYWSWREDRRNLTQLLGAG